MIGSDHSPSMRNSMTSLFEGHQLALQYLVPNLLKLYVDIEFTGSHTQVKQDIHNILFSPLSSLFIFVSPMHFVEMDAGVIALYRHSSLMVILQIVHGL
jgi:hypothetical protein